MTPTHHLLTLWNPSYAADAMDAHLAVLLDWAGRWRRGEAPEDEVYVWWGRLRSPNRKGALPHADAIGALDAQIRSGTETHLSGPLTRPIPALSATPPRWAGSLGAPLGAWT